MSLCGRRERAAETPKNPIVMYAAGSLANGTVRASKPSVSYVLSRSRMGFPLSRSLFLAYALATTGCASYDASLAADTGSASDVTETADTDTDTKTVTTTVFPTHYAISGSLVVESEEINAGASLLHIEYTNPDPELEQGINPLCATDHNLVEALIEPPDFEQELYGWWQVTVEDGLDCQQYLGPETFNLGFGLYDPRLDPAAAEAGVVGTDVYSLFVHFGGAEDSLLVFGLAGTNDNFDGITEPVTAGPMPDDTYQLQTLYLLPLASN